MIVGCVSCYREGQPLLNTVRSALAGCDLVLVAEGQVGDGVASDGPESPLGTLLHWQAGEQNGNLLVQVDEWASDAAKRTAMLKWAKAHWRRRIKRVREHADPDHAEPLWVLWLDGDEVLLFPEYLADWVWRADQGDTATGGFSIRLVELDGSVAKCYGKIIRGDRVTEYLESSYQVKLKNGMVVALPNVPICGSGGVPAAKSDGTPVTIEDMAELRPPLIGEPHLLHRTGLRSPARQVRRMHDAEADWFPNALRDAGLEGVDKP